MSYIYNKVCNLETFVIWSLNVSNNDSFPFFLLQPCSLSSFIVATLAFKKVVCHEAYCLFKLAIDDAELQWLIRVFTTTN